MKNAMQAFLRPVCWSRGWKRQPRVEVFNHFPLHLLGLRRLKVQPYPGNSCCVAWEGCFFQLNNLNMSNQLSYAPGVGYCMCQDVFMHERLYLYLLFLAGGWYPWNGVEEGASWRNPRPCSSEQTLLACRSPSGHPQFLWSINLSPPARCCPHEYGCQFRMNMHEFC